MTLNLENWQNKKYQTLEGVPIRLLCIDSPGKWMIKGIDADGNWWEWDLRGVNKSARGWDLINRPERVTITKWANAHGRSVGSLMYDSQAEAMHYDVTGTARQVPVTINLPPIYD